MYSKPPNQVFDELLVIQYQAGDQKALELLIKRWNPKIMVYALRNINDQQGAEDVAQEVWLAALKGIHRLQHHTKIGSWLLGITHNKSMDWIKKNAKLDHHAVIENSPSTELASDNQVIKMRQAIQKLKMDQQNILTLFYLEGYSLIEISEILKISKGTVKSRLYYARESLKKVIKNFNHE